MQVFNVNVHICLKKYLNTRNIYKSVIPTYKKYIQVSICMPCYSEGRGSVQFSAVMQCKHQ